MESGKRVCAHEFERVFPVPLDMKNDKERADWVRNRRKAWLNLKESDTDKHSLLSFAKVVIKEGKDI